HFQSQPALAAMWGLWGLVLMCMACIDGRSFWLPDVLTLPFLAAGLLLSMLGHVPTDALSAGIGALVGWGTLTAVGYIFYRLTGRMGFGGGDAKLLAGLGAWLGWQLLPWVLMGAALGGVVFDLWQRGSAHVKPVVQNVPDAAIPFGPFLALAAAVLAVHVWP
ncbi:MAG: A24 family peptidase, partial [Comamonadaceae bacterium]